MMRRLLAAALLAAVMGLAAGTRLVQAQTLRIALREDADLLDPTLAAHLCRRASSSPGCATSCSTSTKS